MRSRFGAAAAATVIASIVGGIAAGATVGDEASRSIIHFGVGTGFLLLALAMFDFRVNRVITVIGATAAAIFGGTFVLQGIADLVGSEALSYLAFDVLGHALERILPDLVLAWFAALLLTGSHGRSRLLGWLIVPAVIGLEVAGAVGPLIGRDVPFLKIHLFLPVIWLFAESVKGARSANGGREVSHAAATMATLALAAALLGGCLPAGVKGEGQAVAEPRTVGPFTRLEADRGVDIRISFGATPSVEVRAQSNIQRIVTTNVEGGTLRITAIKELDPAVSIEVAIVTPKLDSLSLAAGATAAIDNVNAARLEVAVEGGAEVQATGAVGTLRLDASGGGQAHLASLTVGQLEADISGGAFAEATVTDAASGSASGGAKLRVLGPGRIDVMASGGGEVTHG
jgi:Putative auto-transporter adhesin, head GIN domain